MKSAGEVKQGAGAAEGDESHHKGNIDSVPKDGLGFHTGGEVLTPGTGKEALAGDDHKQAQDEESHGVVMEAVEKVAPEAATEAAGEACQLEQPGGLASRLSCSRFRSGVSFLP